jgi:hypothetical protein
LIQSVGANEGAMNVNTMIRAASATNKHSYTVPCSSRWRDQVTELARAKQCNVADLARSVVLVVPLSVIDASLDPGEPARDDRETVVLKSGNSVGKPWRRKPRLQVRMAPGFAVETIRKALGLALAIERGHLDVGLESESEKTEAELQRDAETALMREAHDELERLRNVVAALQFDPLPGGVVSRDQALYVLGFPPGSIPDQGALRTRFRRLATVYHPDGKDGSHQRMSQLNAAMEMLRRGGL